MTARLSNETHIALLQADVRKLTADVEALAEKIDKLAEVDHALRLVIRSITWFSGLLAAAGGMWAAWRGH